MIQNAASARFVTPNFVATLLALICILFIPDAAFGQGCMPSYYRTKTPACIDEILAQIRQMPAAPKGDLNSIIGFFAQLFMTSPEARERLLKAEPSNIVKSIEVLSLYRAGLLDEARKFVGNNTAAAELEAKHIPLLRDVTPSSYPGDNDLLIGAYMASGDTALIARILDNFSRADDAMAADGLRVGLLMSKFGPNLSPKDREPVTMAAACSKYQCKINPEKMLRVLTMGTAIWALQSLSARDDGIKKTISDFFSGDPRLKNLFVSEQAAFGNYMTATVLVATFNTNRTGPEQEQAYAVAAKSISIYENLGSSKDAFESLLSLKKK